MRSSILSAVSVLTFAVATACATSPEADLDPVSDTQGTEPSVSMPEPTSEPAKDAGAKDSGAKDSGPKDSGAPPPQQDAAPVDPGACDMSNPINAFIYSIEAAEQAQPVPCPCGAGQCCYQGLTCLDTL